MRTLPKFRWQLAGAIFWLLSLYAIPSFASSLPVNPSLVYRATSNLQLQSPWLQGRRVGVAPLFADIHEGLVVRAPTFLAFSIDANNRSSMQNASVASSRDRAEWLDSPMSDTERWTLGALGSAVSLGTRTLSLLPIGIGASAASVMLGSALPGLLLVGALSVVSFTLLDSAVSAFAVQLSYNARHSIRPKSGYLPLFTAHLMGNLLAAGVSVLGFGGVSLILYSSESLSAFVANAAINLLAGTTGLALLPIAVLSFAVSMIAPAYLVVESLARSSTKASARRQITLLPEETSTQKGLHRPQNTGWLMSISLPELG